MLAELHLVNTGPSPQLDVEFAERLNVFTGDNGLGKSFLLDIAWWTLTGVWQGYPASPYRDAARSEPAEISWRRHDQENSLAWRYDPRSQHWRSGVAERLEKQPRGIVLYARVDGGISVWDPARSQGYASARATELAKIFPAGHFAYQFSRSEIWNGLVGRNDRPVCNGLIHDWVLWQLRAERAEGFHPFEALTSLLAALSPHPREQLRPGEPVRVYRDDPRDFPTLELPHGTIPVIHASAGMQRILALAYVLVWSWHEHLVASKLTGEPPVDSIVFLVDELEAHLHPQWQRRLLPALLRVLAELLRRDMRVQLLATTHAPLVLASLEPHFDRARDRLFHFDLEDRRVVLREEPWAKEGDVLNWLVSDTFGLPQARSVEAERAIEAAEAWMRGDRASLPPELASEPAIEAELRRVLPGDDVFWPRWIVSAREGSRA